MALWLYYDIQKKQLLFSYIRPKIDNFRVVTFLPSQPLSGKEYLIYKVIMILATNNNTPYSVHHNNYCMVSTNLEQL